MTNPGRKNLPRDWLRREVLWVEGDRKERCVTWYAPPELPVSFV